TRTWNRNGLCNYCAISGAEQEEYNGEWVITYIDAVTFSFDIGSLTPSSPATGDMMTRRAGGGWGKPFADLNRGVYRSNDLSSRRHFLMVNDMADCPNGQGARYASWRGYEQMESLSVWQYAFPTIPAQGWGQYFCKSSALDATSRGWTIITDGKFIVFVVAPNLSATNFSTDQYTRIYGFGDILTPVMDGGATFISCDTSASSAYNSGTGCCGLLRCSNNNIGTSATGAGWHCLARRYYGLPSPVWAAGLYGVNICPDTQPSLGCYSWLAWPTGYDNTLHMTQLKVTEGTIIRGVLPLYESAHGMQHGNREIITHVKGLEGRHLMCLRAACNGPGSATYYQGGLYVDITGDVAGKWS
ncbi:MAG: hypothetical protein ACRDD7_05895, partial [Peptostreptococcaceae bacterium]